jgi:5-methylthioadenosine/S-adenosylhomocysteine deaminase
LLSKGVSVVLGTDTAAGTGNMNILEEPRIAATVQLFRSGDQGLLSPQKLLEMVTVDAAAAIKLQDEIGSLEAGKRADIILIDLQNAELAPINDIYTIAVHGITSPHIDSIMIDGQIILSSGAVLSVDESELVAKTTEIRNTVLERALSRRPELAKILIWPMER